MLQHTLPAHPDRLMPTLSADGNNICKSTNGSLAHTNAGDSDTYKLEIVGWEWVLGTDIENVFEFKCEWAQ